MIFQAALPPSLPPPASTSLLSGAVSLIALGLQESRMSERTNEKQTLTRLSIFLLLSRCAPSGMTRRMSAGRTSLPIDGI